MSYFIPVVLVVFVFSGGILLNYHPNVLFNEPEGVIVELPEYKNKEIYESAQWLSLYANDRTAIIGDRSVFDIYSTYFGFVVSPADIAGEVYNSNQTELEKRFLKRKIYFGAYRHISTNLIPDFIVVNKDLLTSPSYYFQLTPEKLEKFDNTPLLKKVYENNIIIIYENVAYLSNSSASFGGTIYQSE